MKGQGTLSLVADSFWTLQPPSNVKRNPLGHWREATVYAANDIAGFLGNGFAQCYDAVDPQYFSLWNLVQRQDVQWLREYFLRVVEDAILYYLDPANKDNLPKNDFDMGTDCCLSIGSQDDGDEDEIMYRWYLDRIDEDSICIVLGIQGMAGSGPAGDDTVLWLSLEALKDVAAVRAAIDAASAANALGAGSSPTQDKHWLPLIASHAVAGE